MAKKIVGLRFQNIGKLYHFDASKVPDLVPGDFAVVETTRGIQLGEIVNILDKPPKPVSGGWKNIRRKATPTDLSMRQTWQKREVEATANCRAKVKDLRMEGVKIVTSEFSFDGKRLTFLYSSEGEERVDVSKLRSAMKRAHRNTQVEMRQIGPRDVAKIIGGMGACGMEIRCCSQFLTEFSPISIKMAKAQEISLTPSEITGMCGRLRCCLVYEYKQYQEARKGLPKRGKRVITAKGEGKVISVNPLKKQVTVLIPEVGRVDFAHDEVEPWKELQALRQKAQEPCPRHPQGGCNCAKNKKQPNKKKPRS